MRTATPLTTLTAIAAGAAIATPSIAQQQATDRQITLAVEAELMLDHAAPAHKIDVATDDGAVALAGSVDSLLARDRALEVASSVAGVTAVHDNLVVDAPEVDDATLLSRVTAALIADPATEAFELNVSVTDGAVTLSGVVDSIAERTLARDAVSAITGVRSVSIDRVAVEPPEIRSDAEILTDVAQRLARSALIDDALIEVAVNNGVVTLHGAVASAIERARARRMAAVAGVTAVDDRGLEVEPGARDQMIDWSARNAAGDQATAAAIEASWLHHPRLTPYRLDASVEDGVATLTGVVDDLRSRNAAQSAALHTIGVRRVKNHIRVRPDTAKSDAILAQEARDALGRNPYTNRIDIQVDVRNGLATLTGETGSTFEKHRATRVVEGVFGITEVVNRLDAQTEWEWKPDWELQDDVHDQLFWSPFVDADQIKIDVEGGVVHLSGRVETWNEKMDATKNAFDAGAKDVRNTIEVDPNA